MIFVPIVMVLLSLFAWSVIPARSRTAVPGAAQPAVQRSGPHRHDQPAVEPAPTLLVEDGSPLWTTRDDRRLERLLKRAARAAGSDPTGTDAAQNAP